MSKITLRNGKVLRSAFCPASCGHVVLAKGADSAAGHHVVWVHPNKPVRTLDPRRARDPRQAAQDFVVAAASPYRPPAFRRDWQKDRVYTMEDRIFDRRRYRMTKSHMIETVGRICRDYGVVTPNVDIRDSKESFYIFDDPPAIEYGSQSVTHAYHEVAHHLDDSLFSAPKLAHHSPRFVRILFDLLERYEGLDPARMETIAQDHAVVVSPPTLTARLMR